METPDIPKQTEPAPEDRVPFASKLAFGMGAVSAWEGCVSQMVNPIFVVMFGLSPAVVSLAQVIYRLYDAFVDLAVGSISDNTRTRWGRRRPYIFVGAILMGLWLPMIWMFNPLWSKTAIASWMVGTYLVFYLFQSTFNIPWQSLLLEMTPDTNERTNVAAFRGYAQKAAAILPAWAWYLSQRSIFHASGAAPAGLVGVRWVTFIVGLLMAAACVLPAIFVRERFYKAAKKQAQVSIRQNFKYTFSNRPFVVLTIFTLLFLIGTAGAYSMTFFTVLCYVCGGNQDMAAKLAGTGSTLQLLTGIMGVPLFQWLANHYGKRRALSVAMWITFTSSVSTLLFFSPHYPYLSLLSGILLAPASTGMWILIPSMTGDVADYDELVTGERREGAFAAVYSWVFKLALSIAAGVAGPIVVWAGYRSAVQVQPDSVLTSMRLINAGLPALFIGMAIFVLSRYSLDTGRVAEIRQELEARRGKM